MSGRQNAQRTAQTTVYIKTDEHNLAHEPCVRVGDIFSVEAADETVKKRINELVLHRFPEEALGKGSGKKVVIFSILKVIEQIHTISPEIEVVNLGETDFIVEYIDKEQQPRWLEVCKLVLVCIITFFGAAFTIMAFNNDISISGVFERFYGQVIGREKPAVTEIEVFYSIGLAIGIMVFFNHVGNKKITMDPTPIQVELRKYETDMSDTVIENASRKGHAKDVGQP